MKQDERPTIFVIFGITGDLAHRRLLPALYHLFKDNLLHDQTVVVGVSRREISSADILKKIEQCVLEQDSVCDPDVMAKLGQALGMQRLDPVVPADYDHLRNHLNEIETGLGSCARRLFYLSIPPSVYSQVVENLGRHGLADNCQHGANKSALLVEKPFGFDLESAVMLITDTNRYFDESQIYRIDHYLAKDTAQNILTFRRENPLFKGVWNGDHISQIEVLTSEILDVKGRGAFYDDVGALRDQVQSHLMQLLTLVTINIPDELNEANLHAAKRQLLDGVETVPAELVHERVSRGQYEGYLQDVEKERSSTESYVSIELHFSEPRWQKTTVRLATGKMLARKSSLVRLTFSDQDDPSIRNLLTFRLQPNEGIDITLQVKKLGLEDGTDTALLDFDYAQNTHRDAYERVLFDAIRGDHMLFASSDEVLASWRILQPVLDAWAQTDDDLKIYRPGEDLIS
jgi:glucose-6-phosphate 1-dehydrogenase